MSHRARPKAFKSGLLLASCSAFQPLYPNSFLSPPISSTCPSVCLSFSFQLMSKSLLFTCHQRCLFVEHTPTSHLYASTMSPAEDVSAFVMKCFVLIRGITQGSKLGEQPCLWQGNNLLEFVSISKCDFLSFLPLFFIDFPNIWKSFPKYIRYRAKMAFLVRVT